MTEEPNIMLVVGEDDCLVNRAAQGFIEKNVPKAIRSTAIETINGVAESEETMLASIGQCEQSFQTPPFLDPVKLTWWRGVTFLPGSARKGTALVKERLDRFVHSLTQTKPPQNQFLLITATSLLATSVCAKTLKTCATVIILPSAKNAKDRKGAAFQRLTELSAEENLTFGQIEAWAFINKVGADTRTIISELQKMRTYIGSTRNNVTTDDIAAIASPSAEEPDSWDLTNAISRRDLKTVATLIDTFDGTDSSSAIRLATILERYFRDMIVFREALEHQWLSKAGWSRSISENDLDVLTRAGYGPKVERFAWQAGRNAEAAQRYSLGELRIARWRILKVRQGLVSGATGGINLVKLELLRALAKGNT